MISNFKCTGDDFERIPEIIVKEKGLSFPKAHTNKEDISFLSKELKKYRSDTICRLPFCVTVESEAFGANIKLGDEKIGPRVDKYIYGVGKREKSDAFTNENNTKKQQETINSIEQIASIRDIDFESGRIKEVLHAIEILAKENEIVCLNVEGPFTIATSLIESTVFYKAIRKNRELINEFMKVLENNIVNYMLKGIEKGVKIISYGDPSGNLDIVGPKIYKELSGQATYNILKKIEPHLNNQIVHICGKTSTFLEEIGIVNSEPIKYRNDITYGEAILNILANNKDIKFIGHNCIKKTSLKLKDNVVWNIKGI